MKGGMCGYVSHMNGEYESGDEMVVDKRNGEMR